MLSRASLVRQALNPQSSLRLVTPMAGMAKFRVPKRQNDKYQPCDYNPWLFKTRNVLQEMDERERFLVRQYVRMMKAPAVLFLHQNNMTVVEMAKVRRDLRQRGIQLQFINSQLLKGQLLDTLYEALVPLLNGPTVAAFPLVEADADGKVNDDPIAVTRDILASIQRQKKLLVLGGKVERHLLGPQQLEAYAKLPTREGLLGDLLGTLQYPAQGLASLMQSAPSSVVRLLDLHHAQQSEEGKSDK